MFGALQIVNAQTLSKKQIAKSLRKMEKADQSPRDQYSKASTRGDTAGCKAALLRMSTIDSLNYPKLEQILKQCGYPDATEGGGSAPFLFWLLVQHQDKHPQFQDSVLKEMKPLVDSGKVSGVLYAYLLDRVNLNTGKLQVYGTQTCLSVDSTKYVMSPCEDPEHVNERRKSIGLGPIEPYLESLNKEYRRQD
jgi:hypothetical protein